jgi:hypothetical protein
MVAAKTIVATVVPPALDPVPPPVLVAATALVVGPAATPAAWPARARWRLVVTPSLAAYAKELRRRGTEVRCAWCGRAGRVAAVVVRVDLGWRREPDEDGG